jgi:hypothetical protein
VPVTSTAATKRHLYKRCRTLKNHPVSTHASDPVVTLVAAAARLRLQCADGVRELTLENLYFEPGETPWHETTLEDDDLIAEVIVPPVPGGGRAAYSVPVRLDPKARTTGDVIAGSAADIIEQLHSFTELGFTGFDLMPGRDQMRAVTEDVVPALRELSRCLLTGTARAPCTDRREVMTRPAALPRS